MSTQTQQERDAIQAALEARDALVKAITAYHEAGFGSHVSDLLVDALTFVNYSIKEVQS